MARPEDENIFFPILGGMASGAAGGAAIGSAVPGIGTGFGAAAGAGTGLLAGVSDIFAQRRAEEEAMRQQAAMQAELDQVTEDFETQIRGIEMGEGQEIAFADTRAQQAGARAGFNEGQIFALQEQGRDAASQRSGAQMAQALPQATAIANMKRNQILNEYNNAQNLYENATQGGGEALAALGNVASAAGQIAPLLNMNQPQQFDGDLFQQDPSQPGPERAVTQPIGPEGPAAHPVYGQPGAMPGAPQPAATGATPAQVPAQRPEGTQAAPAAQRPAAGGSGAGMAAPAQPTTDLAYNDNMAIGMQRQAAGNYEPDFEFKSQGVEQRGDQQLSESGIDAVTEQKTADVFALLARDDVDQGLKEAAVDAYINETIALGADPNLTAIVDAGMGEITNETENLKPVVNIYDQDDYQRLVNLPGMTDRFTMKLVPKKKAKPKQMPKQMPKKQVAPEDVPKKELVEGAQNIVDTIAPGAAGVGEKFVQAGQPGASGIELPPLDRPRRATPEEVQQAAQETVQTVQGAVGDFPARVASDMERLPAGIEAQRQAVSGQVDDIVTRITPTDESLQNASYYLAALAEGTDSYKDRQDQIIKYQMQADALKYLMSKAREAWDDKDRELATTLGVQ